MRFSYVASLGFISQAIAFPTYGLDSFEIVSKGKRQVSAPPQGVGFLPATPPQFNGPAQRVRTDGPFKFVAPTSSDARGPCPGLNAMANHGYLPHNGVATANQFINATNTVFGMSEDLGGFLALFGALVDGDGTSWSINGAPKTGIGGSHNNYETDSSPIRGDLNQYGSYRAVKTQFQTLYDMQPNAATANYNLEVLRSFRGKRFQESIDKNPYFTYLPFSGILVSQAAFTFIYRFMSNKSAEYPEGILNKNVLKSFMSFTGPENNLRWNPGNERIPDNWYKRNALDYYSVRYFLSDVVAFAATQPEILTVGCNQGKVNTYISFSPETISKGSYTADDVKNDPGCFALVAGQAYEAEYGELSTTNQAGLATLLDGAIKSLNCKAFANGADFSGLQACPGFTGIYGGPTGPVAPGAIQDP